MRVLTRAEFEKLKRDFDELKRDYAEEDARREHEFAQRIPRMGERAHAFSGANNVGYVDAFAATYGGASKGPDASTRIPRVGATPMPRGPLNVPATRGTGESKLTPKTRDEQLALRDAVISVGRRLFPSLAKLDLYDLIRVADYASGLTQDRWNAAHAKTPDLAIAPPSLNRVDQGRMNAILRNLADDLTDTYSDRGPLE